MHEESAAVLEPDPTTAMDVYYLAYPFKMNCQRRKASGELPAEMLPAISVGWLDQQLDCHNSPQETPSLNFLAAGLSALFENYLLIYAFYALGIHKDAVVEMIVTDKQKFQSAHQQALTFLLRTIWCPHNLCARI
jgi:hypothetical protein